MLENNPIYNNQPDITWQAGKIPLGEGSIGCAIATEVFEHCPDPAAGHERDLPRFEAWRLLFFTVPFLWPLHEVPYGENRYTPFSLRRDLAAGGFVNIVGGWDASLTQTLGLWVRRRSMGKLTRRILSRLLMPVIYLLSQRDKRGLTQFHESTMITGLSGTARKPKDNAHPGD